MKCCIGLELGRNRERMREREREREFKQMKCLKYDLGIRRETTS